MKPIFPSFLLPVDSATGLVDVTAHSISYPNFLHELTCSSSDVCSRFGVECVGNMLASRLHSHSESCCCSCLEVLHSSVYYSISLHRDTHLVCGNTLSLLDLLLNLSVSVPPAMSPKVAAIFPVIAARLVSAPLSHFANLSSNWVSPAMRSTTLILEFNIL